MTGRPSGIRSYWLWAVMALPAMAVVVDGLCAQTSVDELVAATGEWSARLLLVVLALSPLRRVLPNARWLAWLNLRRRHIGVAAFLYAVLHVIFYVIDMQTLRNILAEFMAVAILTGWLAFVVLLLLGLTSNSVSVRWLGSAWKLLHRWVYVGAALTLWHWVVVHDGATAAWIHFVPLILLEVYRVGHTVVTGNRSAS